MAKDPNWPEIERRYEAGEPDAKICAAFHITAKRLYNRASRFRWDKSKRPKAERKPQPQIRTRTPNATQASKAIAEAVSANSAQIILKIDPSELAARLDVETANARHLADHEELRLAAKRLLAVAEAAGDARLFTSVANAIKTAQDGQRKCLGLDKKDDKEAPDAASPGYIRGEAKSSDWAAGGGDVGG